LCPTYQRAGARNGRFHGAVLSALVYEMWISPSGSRRWRLVARDRPYFWRRRAALSDAPFRPASGSEVPAPFGSPHLSSLGQAWRFAVSQLLAGGVVPPAKQFAFAQTA